MSEKEKPNQPSQNFFERDIDPEVAERVEKIMTEEEVEVTPAETTDQPEINPEEVAASAPLLPSDKLPAAVTQQNSKAPESPAEKKENLPETDNELPNELEGAHEGINLEDPAIENAVDEITREEADRRLAIEDAKAELLADGDAVISDGAFASLAKALSDFWSHTSVKVITIILLLSALAAVAVIPSSRYFVLNAAGVRASASLTILDSKTKQPLKNAEITIASHSAKTDIKGYARLENIRLGEQQMQIKKPAFALATQDITIGWGSNPLGDIDLNAVGSRYSFLLSDFLSGSPIAKAEAISGEASATSDEKGQLNLVVEDKDAGQIDIMITAGNYRKEKFSLPVGDQELVKVGMVPAKKHAFVSKRDGTYDLYKIDADGKNEKKILPGTGSERADSTVLLHHPSDDILAFVSGRENSRNNEGQPLSSLNIINLEDDSVIKVADSGRIQLVNFIGDKLIYVMINDKEDSDSVKRHSIVSYDTKTNEEKELASTNYFNDVVVANSQVFYSPAARKVNGKVGFFKINADGSNRQNIFNAEVWNIFHTSFNELNIFLGKDWYRYDLPGGQLDKLGGAPANMQSRIYASDSAAEQSIWVDERDGKGVLLLYNHQANNDKVIRTAGGLQNPLRWLDDHHIIYRINISGETADYVMSIDGGEPKKIRDVTDTAGLDRFYLY